MENVIVQSREPFNWFKVFVNSSNKRVLQSRLKIYIGGDTQFIMKNQRKNLTYFEIFPNAKFDIKAINEKKTPINTNPKQIQTIIRSIFQFDLPPPFIQIEHAALAEKIVVLIFDGLDVSRYVKYLKILPSFANLSVSQFPIFVEAMEREGFIIGGIKTLLGVEQPKMLPKKYNNFEEMILTDQQLYENGYAFTKPDVNVSKFQYQNTYIKLLTKEQLKEFSELPEKNENSPKETIIAIDAEMIDTKLGSELARLSATNIKGETILDHFFKPIGEVIDYKTAFSGITEETLKDCQTSSADGIKILSEIADRSTIIIGHSLENDLRALKLIHYRCIDTAILYMEKKRKPSLAMIYQKFIGKPFRQSMDGHDSAEDARAAAELAQFAIKEPISSVPEPPKLPSFLTELLNNQKKVTLVDRKNRVNFKDADDRLKLYLTSNDNETADALLSSIEDSDIAFAHFEDMNNIPLHEENEMKGCKSFDENLSKIIEKLPQRTALIVYAPNGNYLRVKPTGDTKLPPGYDPERRANFQAIRQGLLWIHCSETNKE